jgi:gamma-glutamyltranspeptidase/glutathione hydrolase
MTVISILTQMESLLHNNSLPYGKTTNNSSVVSHAFIEATRLAFADRNTYIADIDFIDVPVDGLLDKAYLMQRANNIRVDALIDTVTPGDPTGLSANFHQASSLELPSTTHMSIVDNEGNVVSMTTSIETAFGSRLMVEGFLLNNQLTDFSFIPKTKKGDLIANRVQGGKRPRSSMSPIIVFDAQDQPVLAIGSPGGSSIISYVARVLYDHLVGDLSIEDAIAAKHVVGGDVVKIEKGFPADIVKALEAIGHKTQMRDQTSGLHVLKRTTEGWLGVADPRREGVAAAR